MNIGQRVSYSGEICTIRYVGEVAGTKGEWLGVEWDDPTRGKHDGEAGGKRYFECDCRSREPKAASFIRPSRPTDKERSFLDALRFKYASEHVKVIQIGQPPTLDKPIFFSGKEAEEVGFDKISKRMADLHELKIVLLDGLCIQQRVDNDILRSWESSPRTDQRVISSDIYEICPKITELDLSRNLFTSIHDVAAICAQLEHLKTLRLDVNRFERITMTPTQEAHFKSIFAKVENLTLDSTLLTWTEVMDLCRCFPAMKTLSISSNEYEILDDAINNGFPAITTMKLESNHFNSLMDILPLARIPSLRSIVLKYNNISSVVSSKMPTKHHRFDHVTDLDVSYNAITSWSFINDIATSFSSLNSLRISHNRLYTSLHSPAGKVLTPDDGYMLTIARLPNLRMLNFSNVTEKDRLNAETYYLGLIVQELSLAPESEAERIKVSHPRWRELCEEYGEPVVKREGEHVDPRSLAARLVNLEFELSDEAAKLFDKVVGEKAMVKNVPKRFNIYSVLGVAARAFGQHSVALGLSLAVVTDDWEELNGERVQKTIKLVPETRGIGTFVGERKAKLKLCYDARG